MDPLITVGGLIVAVIIVTIHLALPATDLRRGDAYDGRFKGAWSIERAFNAMIWIPFLWIGVSIAAYLLAR